MGSLNLLPENRQAAVERLDALREHIITAPG